MRRLAVRLLTGLLVTSGASVLAADFNPLVLVPGTGTSRDAAYGDVDGDTDIDILVLKTPGAFLNTEVSFYIQQGVNSGTFTATAQILSNPQGSQKLELGDVDGDNDLDLFVVSGNPTRLWINQGVHSGTFLDSGQTLTNLVNVGVSRALVGDVDGDGDNDLFLANNGAGAAPDQVWINQGVNTGVFVDSGQTLGAESAASAAMGDLDGDGDLDVMVGNFGGAGFINIWINQGVNSGTFASNGQTLTTASHITGTSLGDVDGDGDLDAVLVDNGSGIRILINDGVNGGTFTYSPTVLDNINSRETALADFDHDMDMDFIVAKVADSTVWENQGGAVFVDSALALTGAFPRARTADMDGDGDLDGLLWGPTPGVGILENVSPPPASTPMPLGGTGVLLLIATSSAAIGVWRLRRR